jgi:hypothetical protein
VRLSKLGSWLLLMIISFILVSLVHAPKLPPEEVREATAVSDVNLPEPENI